MLNKCANTCTCKCNNMQYINSVHICAQLQLGDIACYSNNVYASYYANNIYCVHVAYKKLHSIHTTSAAAMQAAAQLANTLALQCCNCC
jgi:hypothetical protein